MASEERILKLKEMIKKDPTDSFSRYAMALEYNGMHDTTTAIEILEELISTDKNYIPAYHQLGMLYGKLNKTVEAKQAYRTGIDLALAAGEDKEMNEMREELEELEDEW
jgi:Tfp pilus assembly protein PilF